VCVCGRGCGGIITLSYLRIIVVILRIPSGKSRQKAFSTCAAHITIFLLFFGSVTLMYLRFSVTFPPLLDKAIALMFAVLAPLFNPIIYSLRNKDMKDAIKKILCSWGFTVVQWLRIHLAMQGTPIQSLVQGNPTCHGTTKPVYHNY